MAALALAAALPLTLAACSKGGSSSNADGEGKETAGKLDDWIEVGVFARGPSGKERDEKVLYLERHHITTADPVITVTVDEAPFEAGFDPYNKLIDRVSSPGGTTIAGLLAAQAAGLGPSLVSAVDATVARDKELGNP